MRREEGEDCEEEMSEHEPTREVELVEKTLTAR